MNQRHPVLSRLSCAICSVVFGGLLVSSMAHAGVSVKIGGDTAAGDQASLVLDESNISAFTFKPEGSGFAADAHLDRHLFCIERSAPTGSTTRLYPHYQLPASTQADDVWNFPDFPVGSLTYSGGLRINDGSGHLRCLTAIPGLAEQDPWHVSHGLFDSGMGDYTFIQRTYPGPQTAPPSGAHQNIKLKVKKLDIPSTSMHVIRVELQTPTMQTPAVGNWRLIDAYNSAALIAGSGGGSNLTAATVTDTDWCLLSANLDFDTLPPNAVPPCAGGMQTGAFVKQDMPLPNADGNFVNVLVIRNLSSAVVAGARQGFAVLRVSGGLTGPGIAEEVQDWYPDDSVWYSY